MNAEGQLNTSDEDGEEEAEGIPLEGVIGNEDHYHRAEGLIVEEVQIAEGLGMLDINNIDEINIQANGNDLQEIRPNYDEHVAEENNEEEVLQEIHPAFAPILPPQPAPILLRRASTSSLDESSQRTSCKTSNGLNSGLNTSSGSSGRPSYYNQNHPSHVLEKMKDLRDRNELCDVTLVAGGHEVSNIMVAADAAPNLLYLSVKIHIG